MAPRSVSLLLLLTLVVAAAGADDEAALIAFKAAAIAGGSNGDTLASWNSSSAGGFCGWVGVTCGGRHRRVVALSLPLHGGLSGSLSPAVGNLSFLRTLDLSSNAFSGGIPDNLGRLRRLRALDLSNNSFSGGPQPIAAGVSAPLMHGLSPGRRNRFTNFLQQNSFLNNQSASQLPENSHFVGATISQHTVSPTGNISMHANVLGSAEKEPIDIDGDETPILLGLRLNWIRKEDERLNRNRKEVVCICEKTAEGEG